MNKLTTEKLKNIFSSYREKSFYFANDKDVEFISSVLHDTFGANIQRHETIEFWKWYCDSMWCASWLTPCKDEVVDGFLKFVTYVESLDNANHC